MENKPKIDPKEVWEVLSQLGLYTHYLATKAIAFWDEYDYSNYRSLQRKAGRTKRVFALFTSEVEEEHKYIVTSPPKLFFDTKEEAQQELNRCIKEENFKEGDLKIMSLWITK